MDTLTPDEFFDRVGVRVPEGVIRNLEEREGRLYVAEGRAGWWWLGPYIPITDEIVDDMCIQRELEL